MALLRRQNIYDSKVVRLDWGISEVSAKAVIQVTLISPLSKKERSANVGVNRWEELAVMLEGAAASLRTYFAREPAAGEAQADTAGATED